MHDYRKSKRETLMKGYRTWDSGLCYRPHKVSQCYITDFWLCSNYSVMVSLKKEKSKNKCFLKHSYLLCDSTTGLALPHRTVIVSMAFNSQPLLETAESQRPMQTANGVQLYIFNTWYILMHWHSGNFWKEDLINFCLVTLTNPVPNPGNIQAVLTY